jgi:hypothetical protein
MDKAQDWRRTEENGVVTLRRRLGWSRTVLEVSSEHISSRRSLHFSRAYARGEIRQLGIVAYLRPNILGTMMRRFALVIETADGLRHVLHRGESAPQTLEAIAMLTRERLRLAPCDPAGFSLLPRECPRLSHVTSVGAGERRFGRVSAAWVPSGSIYRETAASRGSFRVRHVRAAHFWRIGLACVWIVVLCAAAALLWHGGFRELARRSWKGLLAPLGLVGGLSIALGNILDAARKIRRPIACEIDQNGVRVGKRLIPAAKAIDVILLPPTDGRTLCVAVSLADDDHVVLVDGITEESDARELQRLAQIALLGASR